MTLILLLGQATLLRTERFHYDGVRRIQEVVTDPVASPGGALMSGDPELEALALSTVEPGTDEQAAPLAFEQGQVEMMSGGGGPGRGGPGGGGIQPPRIDREYIWGPGDNGLDELLVQYDRYGDEWWAITDAGGDLVALCDLLGEGLFADVARVVAQWTYDAYGAVLTAEHLDGYTLDAAPHLGHKGLFLDRLDANVTQPRLVPFAHALYHARNRVYDVRHARWNQSDPNATALALLGAASHGQRMLSAVDSLDIEALYGNGGSLYGYLGSNTWTRSDPMGLSWVEDYSGVVLPLISVADGLMPVSILNPLLELLQGYHLLIAVHGLVQGAAYDAEEMVDWALDWDRSDDEYGPRTFIEPAADGRDGDGLYYGNGIPGSRRSFPARAIANGRAAERAALNSGKMRMKRMTDSGRYDTSHRTNLGQRFYDGVDPNNRNVMIEVKSSGQSVTTRLKRQMNKDMALIRESQGEFKVKWILYGPENKQLTQELTERGIQFEIVPTMR